MFILLVVNFSVYLNRHVIVMVGRTCQTVCFFYMEDQLLRNIMLFISHVPVVFVTSQLLVYSLIVTILIL